MNESNQTTATTSRHRRKKVLGATVALVAIAGAAFAYWTAGGSGTGSAGTSSSVQDVTVVQTSTTSGLAPGSGAHALSGTFDNPNDGPVYVGTLTASITSVTQTPAGILAGLCTAADYTLTDASEVLNKEVLADDTTTWSGISISFNNTGANQDGCKDATVNLAYTLS